jgi:hypothetical protein
MTQPNDPQPNDPQPTNPDDDQDSGKGKSK